MYFLTYRCPSSTSSSSIFRAGTVRFASTISSSLNHSFSLPSRTFARNSPLSNISYRSLSFSSTFRSIRCSAPRWSHGVNWRSPVSVRAQIRTASPVLERFERKIATMSSEHPFKGILSGLPKPGGGEFGKFYCLPALNDPRIDKLPYSIRILLESAIRNCDNFQVTKEDVEKIIDWKNSAPKQVEIPFKPL